jgi:hypothetical protein
MARINFGANFAIFLLFFGVAVLDAFESSWIKTIFWVAIALIFLYADIKKK